MIFKTVISQDDDDAGVPSLPDTIPYLSNTYQFLTDKPKLIERAKKHFGPSNMLKYNIGPLKSYLLRGPKHMQLINRASHDWGSEGFMVTAMRNLWDIQPADCAKFRNDKSGRLKAPAPDTPPDDAGGKRYWREMHEIYNEYLSTNHYANALAAKFYEVFETRLRSGMPVGEWKEVRLWEFMQKDMFESAMTTLYGPRILELNQDFGKWYWLYDEYALLMAYGVPRVFARTAYKVKDEYYARTKKYVEAGWNNFDWEGEDREADWEEEFGSRFSRELIKWMKVDAGFHEKSIAGMVGTIAFGLNSNTIPAATWMLIHIIRDPSLLAAIREEVTQALVIDHVTGYCSIDRLKLVSLPLLNSVYIEVLRLHVSFTLMREVTNPKGVHLNGHKIPKGAFMQGMTDLAHFDETAWAMEGHPASEFWAARHLVYKEVTTEAGEHKRVAEVSMEGRNGSYFPYGGGSGICPGRHFAKQEILLAVASIVTRFDIEFVEWTRMDGTNSDREARDDPKACGAGCRPPDRDMKVRWKRLW
ncbi:Cytochrome P450 [Rhypophila sp. PSN 637]